MLRRNWITDASAATQALALPVRARVVDLSDAISKAGQRVNTSRWSCWPMRSGFFAMALQQQREGAQRPKQMADVCVSSKNLLAVLDRVTDPCSATPS